MSGLSFRDRDRLAGIQKEIGIEALLLHIKPYEMVQGLDQEVFLRSSCAGAIYILGNTWKVSDD